MSIFPSACLGEVRGGYFDMEKIEIFVQIGPIWTEKKNYAEKTLPQLWYGYP